MDTTMKNLSKSQYSQNTKTTEQRKNVESCKRKPQAYVQGKSIRITSDLSPENLKAKKACNDIFQALKVNNWQPDC
jgi:hypothetical protein